MKTLLLSPFFVLAGLVPALQASSPSPLPSATLGTSGSELPAAGEFAQTGITSLQVQSFGPGGASTILQQTSYGTVTGTLSGSFDDDLMVVIRPNGTFTANFTLTVDCTVGGRQGILTLRAADVGRLVGPTTGQFAGVAVITNATGELAGMRGVLNIEGTVDLVSGLSTYSYAGTLRTAK